MARKFIPLYEDVLDLPGLGVVAQAAYGLLARSSKWQPGRWVPARDLTLTLRLSRSHVKRALESLLAAGLIDVTRPGNGVSTLYRLHENGGLDRAVCYPATCPWAGRYLPGPGQVTCPVAGGCLPTGGDPLSSVEGKTPEREVQNEALSETAIAFGAEIKARAGVPLGRKALAWLDIPFSRGVPLELALEVAAAFTWSKHIRELAFELTAAWERVAATARQAAYNRSQGMELYTDRQSLERLRRFGTPQMLADAFGEAPENVPVAGAETAQAERR